MSNLNSMQGMAQKSNQSVATLGAGKDLYKTMQEINNNKQMNQAFSAFAQKYYNIKPQDLPYIDKKTFETLVKNFKAEGLDTIANSTIGKNQSEQALRTEKINTEKTTQYRNNTQGDFNLRKYRGGPRLQSLTSRQNKRIQTLKSFISTNTDSKGNIIFGRAEAVKRALDEMESIVEGSVRPQPKKQSIVEGSVRPQPKKQTSSAKIRNPQYKKYSSEAIRKALSKAKKAGDTPAIKDLTKELRARGVS